MHELTGLAIKFSIILSEALNNKMYEVQRASTVVKESLTAEVKGQQESIQGDVFSTCCIDLCNLLRKSSAVS